MQKFSAIFNDQGDQLDKFWGRKGAVVITPEAAGLSVRFGANGDLKDEGYDGVCLPWVAQGLSDIYLCATYPHESIDMRRRFSADFPVENFPPVKGRAALLCDYYWNEQKRHWLNFALAVHVSGDGRIDEYKFEEIIPLFCEKVWKELRADREYDEKYPQMPYSKLVNSLLRTHPFRYAAKKGA